MEEQDKKKLEAVKLRMEKLAEELEKHNKAYYIDNAPTVSDEVYDSLFQELARLEKSILSSKVRFLRPSASVRRSRANSRK